MIVLLKTVWWWTDLSGHGFFIEIGSYDGESLSNTLFFEMRRNWTGLLIEANP